MLQRLGREGASPQPTETRQNGATVLPYVHAGWALALAAGSITWVAATYLVGISGASRELTEGFSFLFAAVGAVAGAARQGAVD